MSDTRDRMQSDLDLMAGLAAGGAGMPSVSGNCNIVGNGNSVTINLSLDSSALAALLGILQGAAGTLRGAA
ncbi:MAG: hypothetical protein U1F26_17830 [Lysobacterales bacterium]